MLLLLWAFFLCNVISLVMLFVFLRAKCDKFGAVVLVGLQSVISLVLLFWWFV